MKIYEKMRAKDTNTNRSLNSATNKKKKPTKEEVRCFNCGEIGHKSTTCDSKNKGAKFFRCNEFGHKALDCKKEQSKKTKSTEEGTGKTESVNSLSTPRGMYKIIEIKGKKFNALVDTGSRFNIIKLSSHDKIGGPTLSSSNSPDLVEVR